MLSVITLIDMPFLITSTKVIFVLFLLPQPELTHFFFFFMVHYSLALL